MRLSYQADVELSSDFGLPHSLYLTYQVSILNCDPGVWSSSMQWVLLICFFFDSHIFVTYYTKQLLKLEQIIGAHSYNSTLDTRRLFHWDVAFIWENMAVS